ncbi:aldo/keto reductase [Naasia lichenicola]|nr:aldo/keto reductase [Naasia lichenicola]
MNYSAAADRYQQLEYRRTGRSGLMLPPLSLGLWHNFGDERSIDSQRAILRRAYDRGITHFDLANNYGPPPGSAETNFGRIFSEDFTAHRDDLVISTKAGYSMQEGPYGDWGSRKYLLNSLDASLKRMGLDYVDIFYHHRPDPNTPIAETASALETAVTSGRALYVGISNYSPEQTTAMAKELSSRGIHLLIHQPRYSMFDRHIEEGLFPVLEEQGIGSIVFSPLAQGMLTDRYLGGDIPSDSRAATSVFLSEDRIDETYLARARGLNAIAQDRGQTLAQLALAWVLRQPQVTSALIGASSTQQLDQNLGALDAAPLTDDELAAIDEFAVHGTGLR